MLLVAAGPGSARGATMQKVRREHEAKLEAALSDAQKRRWKEMLGKPFDLGD
jgi:hypothetical protein